MGNHNVKKIPIILRKEMEDPICNEMVKYLTIKDILNMTETCRHFYIIIDKRIWNFLGKRDFQEEITKKISYRDIIIKKKIRSLLDRRCFDFQYFEHLIKIGNPNHDIESLRYYILSKKIGEIPILDKPNIHWKDDYDILFTNTIRKYKASPNPRKMAQKELAEYENLKTFLRYHGIEIDRFNYIIVGDKQLVKVNHKAPWMTDMILKNI